MSTTSDALINEFRSLSEAELSRRFCQNPGAPRLEPGNYKGTWLTRIENAGMYKPFNLITQWLMFDVTPFGISFHGDSGGIWYFFHPSLAAGDFDISLKRSRWRDTDCLALTYDHAKLPGLVRDLLYDEIKPLSSTHALGIGWFNQPAGEGDNFYFLLTRV